MKWNTTSRFCWTSINLFTLICSTCHKLFHIAHINLEVMHTCFAYILLGSNCFQKLVCFHQPVCLDLFYMSLAISYCICKFRSNAYLFYCKSSYVRLIFCIRSDWHYGTFIHSKCRLFTLHVIMTLPIFCNNFYFHIFLFSSLALALRAVILRLAFQWKFSKTKTIRRMK